MSPFDNVTVPVVPVPAPPLETVRASVGRSRKLVGVVGDDPVFEPETLKLMLESVTL